MNTFSKYLSTAMMFLLSLGLKSDSVNIQNYIKGTKQNITQSQKIEDLELLGIKHDAPKRLNFDDNNIKPEPSLEDCVYDLSFVEDVSYEDKSIIQPNVDFTKIWSVKNTGNCTLNDAELMYLDGARMNGDTVQIPTLDVGDVTNISIDLTSPILPGNYRSTWIPILDKEVIGNELWVQLNVEGKISFENYEKLIIIDLSEQMLYAINDSKVTYTFPISSGKKGFETVVTDPNDPFLIYLKYDVQTMNGYALGEGYNYLIEDVPYVMYFHRSYAIHGVTWHTNFGTPSSHGCINLSKKDAKIIYDLFGIGDPVFVFDETQGLEQLVNE